MNTELEFDEATLHAYVDGALDPGRAAAVADWLLDHPRAADQVRAWRAQREGLHGLRRDWLSEPVPATLYAALHERDRSPPTQWPWAAAAAALFALGLGLAVGWGGHALWAERQVDGVTAQAERVPSFVRDAAIAHVVYQPEKRHPVEVTADQQDHLVQWLSKRLGQPLTVPDLADQGLHLVGGRLLPAGDNSGGPLARAQFMYEDAAGLRLTLYVSTGARTAEVPVGFRLTQQTENGQLTRSLYWIDGPLGYALNGPLEERRLRELAVLVHERLK